MGMYDKDENFGEHFNPGDRFVVTGLRYDGEIDTQYGKAKKSTIEVVTRADPKKERYSMLGEGFAAQAQRASAADFPHVAEYTKQDKPGGNQVKLLERIAIDPRAFLDGDDGPASVAGLSSAFGATEIHHVPADDELGF